MKRRGLLRKTPLAPRSEKAAADAVIAAAWRGHTLRRARGCCERCGALRRLDPHHLWPKGRAGRARNYAWNGAALCRRCHDAIHFAADCPDRSDWLASSEADARAIRERLDR